MDWYMERNKKIYSSFLDGATVEEIARKWRLERYTILMIIEGAEKGIWHYRRTNHGANKRKG